MDNGVKDNKMITEKHFFIRLAIREDIGDGAKLAGAMMNLVLFTSQLVLFAYAISFGFALT